MMAAHSMPAESGLAANDLGHRAQIAASTAASGADAVDRDGRFPSEAFSAVKAQRLLSILVPIDLGGEGARVSDVVDVCYALGRACASTGMIFAMHQIMVAILVRHARGSEWHERLLRRLCADQLLLGSSTTEGQGGGNLRASTCAVEQNGTQMSLTKSATVVSYGASSDVILTTARRSPDSPPNDQVLVALNKEDYRLERIVDWNALGMRGTCSDGFVLKGRGEIAQVLPEPYEKIHTHTMIPVAHLTWSGVWSGAAAGAVDRARRFVRGAARHGSGQLPPGAAHFTRASATLRALRGMIASALQRYEAASENSEELQSLEFQTALNLLKVNASEMAISTVMNSFQACGLAGYRNDGEFSISRNLRDILSSSIMLNNDRILANVATTSLLSEVPALLRD
jgi:acyl-CoA dehydrogenase